MTIKETSPEKIFAILSKQLVNSTLPVLIREFDFFNELTKIEPASIEKIADHFKFDKRVLDAVLSYLLKEGFIETTNKASQEYKLAPLAREYLIKNSKYDLSKFTLIFSGNLLKKVENSISFALKTGKPAGWNEAETWEEGMTSGSIAKTFSEGLMSKGKYSADKLAISLNKVISRYTNLIDIGGSLGDYCGKFTEKFPNLSCTVYDLPKVIEHAKENIIKMRYKRVSTIAGDMFKENLPKNFDIHFYSNVFHDWTQDQIVELLKKSYGSLNNNGIVIINDLHLNNDKQSPNFAIDHSLYLSIFTDGKCYSYKEIENMIKHAGFKKVKIEKPIAGYSVIIGYK